MHPRSRVRAEFLHFLGLQSLDTGLTTALVCACNRMTSSMRGGCTACSCLIHDLTHIGPSREFWTSGRYRDVEVGNAHFSLVVLLWASDFQGFIAGVTMLITRVSFLPAATAPAKSAKLCPQIAPSAIGRGPCITYKVCTRMMYSESSRQN